MPVLHVDDPLTASERAARARAMEALIAVWREAEGRVVAAEAQAAERFAERGRMLPRARLALLLDRGAPFLELSSLAGLHMHDDRDGSGAGGGLICGIGYVAGVRCMVKVSNSAVKGGTVSPAGLAKALRAQTLALENKLPLIYLVESGGANLAYQSEIFIEGGRGFAAQARLSAAGIPQITVVHGNATAGGAYMPGLSDYVVMVRGHARVFLAGPPLLKAATGEVAEAEELGGAEMHATRTGSADFLVDDDRAACLKAREIVASLGWETPPERRESRASVEAPRYAIDDLVGLVPADFSVPYDVRQVIARLVDGSRFSEFKPDYDGFTVCGRAFIDGHAVGLIGNNGPITAHGAGKAAQFIQQCCQSGTPLIYLQNTTGYMVGTRAEQAGIVKAGSKMIQAVACATVPQITLVLGGSFGAGNYGMCGRGLDPRFIFSWPSARVGVMGPRQAAGVMTEVTRAKAARKGQVGDAQKLRDMEAQIIARMEAESSVLYGTARLWDDGIVDPRDSRRLLSLLLDIVRGGDARTLRPNSFGVPHF